MFLIICIAIAAVVGLQFYLWLREKHLYWEKRKVKYLKPTFLFGNSFEVVKGNRNQCEIIEDIYLKFPKEDIVGYYEFLKPQLIIRNPEIIENILVKDFSHFTDRMSSPGPPKNLFAANLFNMCGDQWRAFRYKLSPIFTSGKLKHMYGPLSDCGNNLENILKAHEGKEVDMKEVMSLFAIDVIGSSAFGIEPGVMQDPSSKFRAQAKKIFEFDMFQYFRIIMLIIAPKLANKFGIHFVRTDIMSYFCNILSSTLKFRKKHGLERNDILQMLSVLKEKGQIEMHPTEEAAEEIAKPDFINKIKEIKITDDMLMGTAFGFLSAGFHTTAATLTYALYELSQKPQILQQVRSEINSQIAVHGGLTYDALRCMVFLEKVIKETMRIHPAAPTLFRVCTKAYELPNGLRLVPGDTVIIPVFALHRDPFLHEDSFNFKPERFDSPPPLATYLPFGAGPRICIAMRFAMIEMKFALSKILSKYDIYLSKSTKTPLQMSSRGFLNTPEGAVNFNVSSI